MIADCFFDNDKIYVVYGINQLRIAELDADFNKIPGNDKDVVKWSFPRRARREPFV